MGCYHPLQASFSFRRDGKKDVKFSNVAAKLFKLGLKPSRWWEANHPYDPVFNVTHWLELLKIPVKKK